MLEQIMERIISAGWNLYECGEHDSIETMVPRGAAKSLEVGKQYVLFPKVDNPINIKQVMATASYMENEKIFPVIRISGKPQAMALIRVEYERIKVIGPTDVYLSYADFYQALLTLPLTKRANWN